MNLIRSLAACSAVALGLSMAPGVAPPASAESVLVAGRAPVSATPGQTLLLGALFSPAISGVVPQYLDVVVTLTGGLTFPEGSQVLIRQGGNALPLALGIAVTAKSSGVATVKVTALVNNRAIVDEAVTAVDVPILAPPPDVRLITAAGPASVKVGQTLLLGSLFKPVETGKQFNTLRYLVSVDMTGGLVFVANGAQSTGASGLNALKDVLLIEVRANSPGTVRLRITAMTPNFEVKDEATESVNVPAPVPAPTVPPVPAPAPTAGASGPAATTAPASSGNRPPTAVGKSAVVKVNTSTALALKGTDPEGATLVYSVVDFPEHGRLTGRAPNLSYVPDKGFVGADAFTFTVSDRASTSEEAVVSITVIPAKKAVVRKATVRKTTKKK